MFYSTKMQLSANCAAWKANFFSLSFIFIFLLTLFSSNNNNISEAAGSTYYQIPNPFDRPETFYYIKSFQSTISANNKRTQVEVDEYFSLQEGLSFSLHRDRDDLSKVFVLIGDGERGKSYLVRNVDYKEVGKESEQLDCELDHVHYHKHTFPWQYVYKSMAKGDSSGGDDKKKSNKQRKKQKNKWTNMRFIYGVGAIWLNAIERKIVSNEVQADSPYSDSNLWQMSEGELKIKLLFDKPKNVKAGQQIEALIGKSKLNSLQMTHEISVNRGSSTSGVSVGKELENISIVDFDKLTFNLNEPTFTRFKFMLESCRQSTEQHRLFPSLMRALSLSPERLFSIDYIERHYATPTHPPLQFLNLASGSYDERLKRYVWSPEYRREFFSLKHETQTTVYQEVPQRGQLNSTSDDGSLTNPEKRADIFMKKFTEREQSSSGHSTVSYHIHEHNELLESCKVGEAEPNPADHLLMRPVHFLRTANTDKKLSGILTGLGALIMNAADVHYKQFQLFKKQINAIVNPVYLSRKLVKVDEWRVFDKQTGRSIHFYFLDHDKWYYSHEITDLVRIEVRNADGSSFNSDDVVEESKDEDRDNVIVVYDIVHLLTQLEDQELELFFSVPEICRQAAPPPPPDQDDNQTDNKDNDDQGVDNDGEEFQPDDDWYKFFDNYDDDDNNQDDGTNSDNQPPNELVEDDQQQEEEANEFEFHPGAMMESFQFPDFFEFLDGAGEYVISSRIQFDSAPDEPHIELEEVVNLEQEWTKLKVSRFDLLSGSMIEEAKFYINYRTEFTFRVDAKSGGCVLVDQPDAWLNFLSAKFSYYKTPTINNDQQDNDSSTTTTGMRSSNKEEKLLVEGNKLRWFGVGALWRQASESAFSNFLGMRREIVVPDETNKHQFKRVLWSLTEDGDVDNKPTLYFAFLFNITRWQHDVAMKRSRRTIKLLTLDSIYLDDLPDNIENNNNNDNNNENNSQFKKLFTIKPLSIERTVGGASLYLPASCQSAVIEANKMEKRSRGYYGNLAIPRFDEFLQGTRLYSFLYDVKQFAVGRSESEGDKMSETQLDEYFNLDKNQGKISFNAANDRLRLFIDGQTKTIYSYSTSTKLCYRIASIRSLIESEVLKSEANNNFDVEKGYGLGALWIQLQQLARDVHLRIHLEQNIDGTTHEIRTYKAILGDKKEAQSRVIFIFESAKHVETSVEKMEGEYKKQIIGADYNLRSIEILPKEDWRSVEASHHALIEVRWQWLKWREDIVWDLPEPCKSISPIPNPNSTPDQQQASGFQFPKLMHMIRETNQFYMRSEITVSRAIDDEEKRFYLLDEWLYNGSLRMKTQGLKKNIDLLVYGQTSEVFDLSERYKCPNRLPDDIFKPTLMSNFVPFWSDDKTIINKLSQLYYSPLSLWRLAEKNLDNVKLSAEIVLAPKPKANTASDESKTKKKSKEQLAKEFRSEIWRVTAPESKVVGANSDNQLKWSYDMHFERFFQADELGNNVREWAVLQRIEIVEPESMEIKRTIEIDTINYDWNQKRDKFQNMFLLPDGYNCERSREVQLVLKKFNDVLDVNLNEDYALFYEASLELYDEEGTEKKRTLPNISGAIYRSNTAQLSYGDLYAHYSRARRPNGNIISTKQVYDTHRTILYEINRLTGVCMIGFAQHFNWQLEFVLPQENASKREEIIVIKLDNTNLMSQLLKQNYVPANRYSSGLLDISTYYQNFFNMTLTEESQPVLGLLKGPVTVIRKFKNIRNKKLRLTKNGDNQPITRMRDSMSVKVLMFNRQRTSIIAELNLNILAAKNIETDELIEAINVGQCYNDGMRKSDKNTGSYVIEYHRTRKELAEMTTYHLWPQELEREFVQNLIRGANLLPTQLNGSPKVDFTSNSIKFHFRVLDVPSALEYFKKKAQTSMSDELMMQSEFKLLPDVQSCSNWCDQVQCVAMTYCTDRTCSVLTANQVNSDHRGFLYKLDSYLESKSTQKLSCTYFYKSDLKPPTLKRLNEVLDSIINEGQDSNALSVFALSMNQQSVLPTKFYQLNQNLISIKEDSDVSKANTDTDYLSTEQALTSYKFLKRDIKLSVENFNKFAAAGKLMLKFKYFNSFAECLDMCKDSNCMLVSFCKQNSSCAIVSGDTIDLFALTRDALEEDKEHECSVSVKDLTLKYTRFEKTMKPTKYEIQLDNHSANECAARCDSADQDTNHKFICLSFDYCLINNGQEERSVCFLQQMHVMLDDFDRLILETKHEHKANNSSSNENQLFCEHYSKSVLTDYDRIPNRKFLQTSTTLRGISEDKCALDCSQDDDCRGFEFCFDDKMQPAQSCFLIRTAEHVESITGDGTIHEWVENLKKLLKPSKTCSVFTLKHRCESFGLDDQVELMSPVDMIEQELSGAGVGWLMLLIGYLIAAIIIGTVIQVLYTKAIGRPVIFRQR